MLLAYIDEIGETGAFVSPGHSRFNTSPAFGYAGFVLPEYRAMLFGQEFTRQKRTVFKTELEGVENPGAWEKKGADIFRPDTPLRHAYQLRVVNGLVKELARNKGTLFYFASEKSKGTPKQVDTSPQERRNHALKETVNRLARYAQSHSENILIMMDSVQEKERRENVQTMYAHVFARKQVRPEMARVVEPPMHVDSVHSSNIQFADWAASFIGRAIDYQLISDSKFSWIVNEGHLDAVRGNFTYESKLELWHRAIEPFHHSEIFRRERLLYPQVMGQSLGSAIGQDHITKMHAIASKSQQALGS